MSVRTMAKVWESSQHAGSDLLMLLAIADFSDDEGNAYPAVSTLAGKCRMKVRNCQYLLRNLEKSGELSILQNAGPHGSNLYRVNLSSLGVQHSAGVQSLAGVQHSAPGGAKDCAKGVQRIASKPSVNHQEPSITRGAANKASRLPADFQVPADWIEWAMHRRSWSKEDTELVAAKFKTYWTSPDTPRPAKKDWRSTWEVWVDREKKPLPATGISITNFKQGVNDDGSF